MQQQQQLGIARAIRRLSISKIELPSLAAFHIICPLFSDDCPSAVAFDYLSLIIMSVGHR